MSTYYDEYLEANRAAAASDDPNYSEEYRDANRKNAQTWALAQKKKEEIAARESNTDVWGSSSGASSKHAPGETAEFFGSGASTRGRTTDELLNNWAHGGAPAASPRSGAATGVEGTVITRNPSQPYVAPVRPKRFSKKTKNRGWNSWARSIDPLTTGNYLLFTVATGGECGLLGIAPPGWEGRNISRFSHAIVADIRGIKVYEYGQIVATLKAYRGSSSLIRIHRQTDNSIVYVVTTGTETIVHTSNEPLPYHIGKNVYAYGMLYSSDDRVTSSSFESGVVQYGSV